MLGGGRRRALAFGLLLALLAVPVSGAPGAPDWDRGDVEAAERYRALERERALRFRAAAEGRFAEPRRGERAQAERGEPTKPRVERAERPRRERDSSAEARSARSAPAQRDSRIFEPWVGRLADAIADAVLGALVQTAQEAWRALRQAVETWLEEAFGERVEWTDADSRRRE